MYFSTTFKYMCTAMALLASPAKAAVGNWDISYLSTATNFTQGATNDITLSYIVGTGRAFNIDLFTNDCQTAIDITITNTNTRTVGDPSSTEDTLEIMFDLDKTDITSSNIWDGTNDVLEFCAVLQLLSGTDVIKEDKRDIDITFDFTVDFDADEDVALTSPNLNNPSQVSSSANVDSYISACKCDYGSWDCNSNAFGADDTLDICIKTASSDVELLDVTSLSLLQDNTGESMDVVQNNAPVDSDISEIQDFGYTRYIETIVPSRFFGSTDNVAVSGVVEVQFVGGTRKLVAFGLDDAESRSTVSTTIDSGRIMRGDVRDKIFDQHDTIQRPGYPQIAKSSFGFSVGLIMPKLYDEIDTSAGTFLNGFGAAHILGSIVCFAWAYFG